MYSRKRAYSTTGGTPKASRLVGGRTLSYRPSAPLPGSYRARMLGPINQQALRTGGWANPSAGGELKFVDNSATTSTNLATTWSAAILLNGLANGSDASTRIGRKVTMKSLLVRYVASLQAGSTQGSPVRILIIYDKQANAAAPGITEILLADDFRSPNNLSNRDRFVTLADTITDPIAVNGTFSVAGVIYKKFSLETMFNQGTAGTIGDITSGSVYMFVSQTGTAGVAAPQVLWRSRIRYTDV